MNAEEMCKKVNYMTQFVFAYSEILSPKTAVFLKRFTQATERRHQCFQSLTAYPRLTASVITRTVSINVYTEPQT